MGTAALLNADQNQRTIFIDDHLLELQQQVQGIKSRGCEPLLRGETATLPAGKASKPERRNLTLALFLTEPSFRGLTATRSGEII